MLAKRNMEQNVYNPIEKALFWCSLSGLILLAIILAFRYIYIQNATEEFRSVFYKSEPMLNNIKDIRNQFNLLKHQNERILYQLDSLQSENRTLKEQLNSRKSIKPKQMPKKSYKYLPEK